MVRVLARFLAVARWRDRRRIRQLESQLLAERERSRVREEHLLDRVLEASQLRSLPKPASPAPQPESRPVLALTPEQEEARELYQEWAREVNVSPSQAVRDWERDYLAN